MLLEIDALNLSLREGGRALLRGINLSLQEGDSLTVLGMSGSGKRMNITLRKRKDHAVQRSVANAR